MVQNLIWATAYNLVAIPVAADIFVRWGFDLPMSVGAVAMSASTIIVAANAQLIRGLKLQPAARMNHVLKSLWPTDKSGRVKPSRPFPESCDAH